MLWGGRPRDPTWHWHRGEHADQFLGRYEPKAVAAGVDALGYYLPPYVYAGMQVRADAVEATTGLDQKRIADYIREAGHHTIVGDIQFGADGEWAEGRILQVQYQGIEGNGLDQFREAGGQVILFPPGFKSGTVQYRLSNGKR